MKDINITQKAQTQRLYTIRVVVEAGPSGKDGSGKVHKEWAAALMSPNVEEALVKVLTPYFRQRVVGQQSLEFESK